MQSKITDYQTGLFLFILAVFALLYNLGVHPVYLEEPRRALIAMEMDFSNNLWVPTVAGEFYYKKPPVFNWAILSMFKLAGNYEEESARMVTVLSYLLWAGTVFWLVKKFVSPLSGLLASLLFLVCADVLFYYSMVAGIDVFYSFLSFLSICSLFYFYKKGQLLSMFLVSYALTGMGALTKGFPSLVFLGFSVIIFLFWKKDLKKLYSWQHLAGILTLFLIIGVYLWQYSRFNSPMGYVEVLWGESSQRTLLQQGLAPLISNFFMFPFKFLKVFLPASLLLIFALRKDLLNQIKKNEFILFCVLMLAGNIWVYWISPGSRMRYIYTLIPFAVIFCSYLYTCLKAAKWQIKTWNVIMVFIMGILPVLFFLVPYLPQLSEIKGLQPVALLVGSISLVISLIYFIQYRFYLKGEVSPGLFKKRQVYFLVLALLLARLVFDASVLPYRRQKGDGAARIAESNKIRKATQGKPLYLYKDTPIWLSTLYYLEKGREEIIRHSSQLKAGHYYLTSPAHFNSNKMENIMYIESKEHHLYLVTPKQKSINGGS